MNPLQRKMFMQQGGVVPEQMMAPPPQQMMAPFRYSFSSRFFERLSRVNERNSRK